MSTDTSSRVPAGVPTGGQFAASAKSEADVALDRIPSPRDDFPRHPDGTLDAHEAVKAGLIKGFAAQRSETPVTRTMTGHWDGNTLVIEYIDDGQIEDTRVDTGQWEQGLWCDSATGHSDVEIAAEMLDGYDQAHDIRVATGDWDYTDVEDDDEYDDDDEDQYTLECGHCGTYVSELGMDATGSRRCDDLDPDHRFHSPEDQS